MKPKCLHTKWGWVQIITQLDLTPRVMRVARNEESKLWQGTVSSQQSPLMKKIKTRMLERKRKLKPLNSNRIFQDLFRVGLCERNNFVLSFFSGCGLELDSTNTPCSNCHSRTHFLPRALEYLSRGSIIPLELTTTHNHLPVQTFESFLLPSLDATPP